MSVTIVSTGVQLKPKVDMPIDNIPNIDENAQQEYRKIAIRRVVRKLDRRLIPFLFLLEAGSYINRVSIGRELWLELLIIANILLGNAKLMGIESDLNLSHSEFNWAVSLFFLAYVRKVSY